MYVFRFQALAFSAVLALVFAVTSAQAATDRHHPMAVLNERISTIENRIETLRNAQTAMGQDEKVAASKEIYGLVQRLSYLQAAKIHLQDVPKEQVEPYINYVLADTASPTTPSGSKPPRNGSLKP